MTTEKSDTPLLAGIGVVEHGANFGVRYCGRLFSQLGATVVHIAPTHSITAFEEWLDEGKDCAATIEDAVAIIKSCGADPLLSIADPSVSPDIRDEHCPADYLPIELRLSWYGIIGPYRDWPGDDVIVSALSGLAYSFGEQAGPPVLAKGYAPQLIGGLNLFIAGLAALWQHKADNNPMVVDASILESVICLTEHAPPSHLHSGAVTRRLGINRFGGSYPTAAYRSADGWIGVTAHTPDQWRSLCTLLQRPELERDPRFSTGANRMLNADLVDCEIGPYFASRTTEVWLTEAQAMRLPFAPVPCPAEILGTPHWKIRGSFSTSATNPALQAPNLPFRARFDHHVRNPARSGSGLPLSGIRVLDFTMGWAGPLATRHLADLGATIIKVEHQHHIDWSRGWAPDTTSNPPLHELASAFNIMNRNKLGIVLDLNTQEGYTKAMQLAATADIVIDNFGAGVMDKFGLSPDALQAARPGLIIISMAAFGAFGPWSHFRGYGSTVEQASGLPLVNGCQGWPPSLQHLAFGDPIAGLYAAAFALAALNGLSNLGGSYLDLSQVECLFQLSADAILESQVSGPPARLGSRSSATAPRCVVRAKGDDMWVAITCRNDTDWHSLANLLGQEDWLADASLKSASMRNERHAEIEGAIGRWVADMSGDEAAARLRSSGIPAAVVQRASELHEDAQLVSDGFWIFLERAYIGRHIMAAPPYRFNGVRPPVRFAAPLLGEHSEDICEADLAWP